MKNNQTVPALINLNELVSRLISSYQPLAEQKQSFFTNDVPTGLSVTTDQEVLSTLLGSLFYIVAKTSRNNSISVLASSYDDRAVISITDSSPSGSYGVLYEFQHLQLLSKEIGGFLEINSYKNKQTVISYNFINAGAVQRAPLPHLRVA